jgi:ribosome production factor 1
LRWLKKGIPAVQNFGEEPKPLAFDVEPTEIEEKGPEACEAIPKLQASTQIHPPKQAEFLWAWKVRSLHF